MKIFAKKPEVVVHSDDMKKRYVRKELVGGGAYWSNTASLKEAENAEELEREYQEIINKPVTTEAQASTSDHYKIVGFKASNDHGKTWFNWYFNDHINMWMVNEPESLAFTTENMLKNAGNYTLCVPILEKIEVTNEQPKVIFPNLKKILGMHYNDMSKPVLSGYVSTNKNEYVEISVCTGDHRSYIYLYPDGTFKLG
jgi:hypothetical protein